MNKYVLLVTNDEEFETELLFRLEELEQNELLPKNGMKLMIDIEKNAERAKMRLKRENGYPIEYDLLVVDIFFSPDEKRIYHENEKSGLKFIKSIAGVETNILIICPFFDQEIVDFQARRAKEKMNCKLLCKDSQWVDTLGKKVKEILRHSHEIKWKRGRVDIFLDHKKYTMKAEKNIFPFDPRTKYLNPNYEDLQDELIERSLYFNELIERSLKSNEEVDWNKVLQAIGVKLFESLLNNNSHFSRDFKELTIASGGIQNIMIRYFVEKKIHPIVLEAIVDEDEYCMLQCPVFRSIDKECIRPPLFKDDETRAIPINCLIINAASMGDIDWGDEPIVTKKPLDPIKNAEKEISEILTLLSIYKKERDELENTVGQVLELSPEKGESGFRKRVEEELSDPDKIWHVVHFIGHSLYDKKSENGFVFFPGGRGQPEACEIDLFAKWLRNANARFVYLSSCSSASSDFVFTLVQQDIPAILGFRCPIGDAMAVEHAKVFYERLFLGSKKLEYAFLETRKELEQKYKTKDFIWATSILTMQHWENPG